MLKISTENQYKCARCGKIFDTMNDLTAHSKRIHGPKTPVIVTTSVPIEARLPDQPAEIRK